MLLMPRYLPVALNLERQPALVVGAGAVGTEKVLDFLERGAVVTVVSPVASEAVRREAAAGRVRWLERRYEAGDAGGFFFVMVATDDPETNAAIYAEASARGQLINVCDDPAHCNVIFASKIERGPLTVSIFTHGASPAFSKRVRRELERVLGPEYGEFAAMLGELRPRVLAASGLTQPQRQRIFERIVYSDALYLLAEGDRDGAARRIEEILEEEMGGTNEGERRPPALPSESSSVGD
jgi:precorrin-2 dehydrogenase/sirohydrochlorin ferrochelatase